VPNNQCSGKRKAQRCHQDKNQQTPRSHRATACATTNHECRGHQFLVARKSCPAGPMAKSICRLGTGPTAREERGGTCGTWRVARKAGSHTPGRELEPPTDQVGGETLTSPTNVSDGGGKRPPSRHSEPPLPPSRFNRSTEQEGKRKRGKIPRISPTPTRGPDGFSAVANCEPNGCLHGLVRRDQLDLGSEMVCRRAMTIFHAIGQFDWGAGNISAAEVKPAGRGNG